MPPCDDGVLHFRREYAKVSILVLMDAALRHQCIRRATISSINVSILVLVDAALRLRSKDVYVDEYRSFNPCFSGCRPATSLQGSQ